MIDENCGDVKIVIAQRGWVFVGRFSRVGSDCKLTSASVIRRWGTTRGIGELINGPLNDTILDPCGVVRFDSITIVATIDCNEEKWKNVL